MRASHVMVAVAFAVSCNGTKIHEARTLAQALETFSLATPLDRPRALRSLESVKATDSAVLEAQSHCVAYARKLHEALTLKDEVALRYADVRAGTIEKTDPIAIALPAKLDAAEAALKAATTMHGECRRLLTQAGAP